VIGVVIVIVIVGYRSGFGVAIVGLNRGLFEVMGLFLWADPRTSCFVDKEIFIGANGSFNKRCCEICVYMRYMLIYYCSKNKSSRKIYPEVIYLYLQL